MTLSNSRVMKVTLNNCCVMNVTLSNSHIIKVTLNNCRDKGVTLSKSCYEIDLE